MPVTNPSAHIPAEIEALAIAADRPVLVDEVAHVLGLSHKAADEYVGRLARRDKLVRRGPGVFTRPRQGRPHFELTSLLRRAHLVVRREMPFSAVVGWSTEWLSAYAHNVPLRHWTMLEASAALLPTLADLLARDHLRAVVDPSPETVPDLLRLFQRPLLLLPNGESYGASKREGLRVPSPERLTVDFYLTVTRRRLPYPHGDMAKIIAALVAERDLNVASILAYARRRRVGKEFGLFLRSLDGFPPDVAEAVSVVVARHISSKPEVDA